MVISSYRTEMDAEIEFLMLTDPPRRLLGLDVDVWAMESEAWSNDLKQKLRVMHYERRYEASLWKKERRTLRIVTSAQMDVLPTRQGWKVGRCRWIIENRTFNILTRDYSLEHNYHHHGVAIIALLVLRSLAYCISLVYRNFAIARSNPAPKDFLRWYLAVVVEDWVRFLDNALGPEILDSS